MSTSNVADMIKYIATVKLVPPKSDRNGAEVIANAFIGAGAILLFPDFLPYEQQVDALNWILFGQLAADRDGEQNNYNRASDPVKWYNTFTRTLGNIGMRSGAWERHRAESDMIQETVAKTALTLLKPFLNENLRILMGRALHNLHLDYNKRALEIFNKSSTGDTGANFLVIGASVDQHLNLTLYVTYIDFQTEKPVKDVLSEHRDQVEILFYGRDTLTLAKSLADLLRGSVKDRLGDSPQEYIAPIKD